MKGISDHLRYKMDFIEMNCAWIFAMFALETPGSCRDGAY